MSAFDFEGKYNSFNSYNTLYQRNFQIFLWLHLKIIHHKIKAFKNLQMLYSDLRLYFIKTVRLIDCVWLL